ncbi:S8 family serine peptidase [Sphingomonas qilianensis]|uniref:S8 family serine peptidase n=1 Tax=Sphingomonas qilianensis TaxID=1736690 RepID=A0ABU9XRL6_9SPHN
MDPALQELIAEGRPEDEVAIVVRLQDKAEPPVGMRLISRFGPVATARAQRDELARLHADPAIASLKAPRLYAKELDAIHEPLGVALEGIEDSQPGDERRPAGLAETGKGTIVCVIDWSCDFAHPDFRHPDGRTRLLALWDQRIGRAENRYGYGRMHDRAAIDRALLQQDPFVALGYPCTDRAHGTHVMGIAAGNGRAGGPAGVAPEADLIFVHLGNGGEDLGSSIELLEAVDFAVRMAGDRPLAINFSLGRHAGPHDGTLLIERAIDWLLMNRPGTAIVQSTGNYYSRDVHMNGRISEARIARLPFRLGRRDTQPVSVEIWYKGADEFIASARGPDGVAAQAPLGGKAELRTAAGQEVGRLYHRRNDPNNGDNLINLFLNPHAKSGAWELQIEGIDVVDGRWHAWIERNAACAPCQGQFPSDLSASDGTTGSICNALRTIAVGAYDGHDPAHPLPPFSSVGPTRDGRRKPLLAAPGVRTLSVRSRADPAAAPGYVRMSGTSMAAPLVTGTLALMLQAAGPQRISALRRCLFASLAPVSEDNARWGYGKLDIMAAVVRARALAQKPPPKVPSPAGPIEGFAAPPPPPQRGSGSGRRVVPIVVLPGIMGTRLDFTNSPLPRWDPDNAAAMLGWFRADPDDKLRGLDMRSRVTIVADGKHAGEHRRGWDQLPAGFYRPLLTAIDAAFNRGGAGAALRCPVWAMGYDWRQSNLDHAHHLASYVDLILKTEHAPQLILLTHSMGGLMARAALVAYPRLAGRIAGVIHAMQPAVGAVVAARRFRTGFTYKIDGSLGEAMAEMLKEQVGSGDGRDGWYDEGAEAKKFAANWIMQAVFSSTKLGPHPEYYARLMAGVAGANELLPSDGADRGWWPHAAKRPTISVFDLYAAGWDQGGLIPTGLRHDPAGDALAQRLAAAKAFHDRVGGRYHPVTGLLYSDGLTTDTQFDPQQRHKAGDGTVPTFSARAPDLAAPHFVHAFSGVEHAACFRNKAFRAAVIDGIAYIAGGGPALGRVQPPKFAVATQLETA